MRVTGPDIPNMIANHPAVVRNLEWVPEDHPETDGWLLLGPQVADLDNWYFLVSGNQQLCMMFEWSAPGVFQMHTMSLPCFRGKEMIHAARQLIHDMFVEHGAETIWGLTPLHNRQARMFNRMIGAVSCGNKTHHVCGECEVFRNHRDPWLANHWKGAAD